MIDCSVAPGHPALYLSLFGWPGHIRVECRTWVRHKQDDLRLAQFQEHFLPLRGSPRVPSRRRSRLIIRQHRRVLSRSVCRAVPTTPCLVQSLFVDVPSNYLDELLHEARPGRPRTSDDDEVAAVIERTLRKTPDATHWSIRSMGQRLASPTPRSAGCGRHRALQSTV